MAGVDLILRNGRLRGYPLPEPAALAIRNGRVLALGPERDVLEPRQPSTAIVDCGGGWISRAYVDHHLHLLALAATRLSADCSAATSVGEIQGLLRLQATRADGAGWVRGWGYEETSLREARHPTRAELDRAVPHRPVRLRHRSRHANVLNTLALQHLGIALRQGGASAGPVARDTEGWATGLLIDLDTWIAAKLPPRDAQQTLAALAATSVALAALGIVAVHDATVQNDAATWLLFASAIASGLLRQDVSMFHAPLENSDGAEDWAVSLPREAEASRLRRGPLKVLLSTASGSVAPDSGTLRAVLRDGARRGPGVAFHVADLESLAVVLDAIEAHRLEGGRCLVRCEHVPLCPPPFAETLAALGVTTVVQPGFVFATGDRYLALVEPELQPYLYPLRTLLRAGVRVLASSDAPVGPLAPAVAVRAAVERRTRSGAKVGPSEALHPDEARRLYWPVEARRAPSGLKIGDAADVVVVAAHDESLIRLTLRRGHITWRDPAL